MTLASSVGTSYSSSMIDCHTALDVSVSRLCGSRKKAMTLETSLFLLVLVLVSSDLLRHLLVRLVQSACQRLRDGQ